MTQPVDVAALVHRLEVLERRQRQWTRGAVVCLALGVVLLAGWAPIDKGASTGAGAKSVKDLWELLDVETQPAGAAVPQASDPARQSPSDLDASSQPRDFSSPAKPITISGFRQFTHAEGDEPYVPSRMEWLSLRASAQLPAGNPYTGHYAIMYGFDGRGTNTLKIVGTYDAQRADRNKLVAEMAYARRNLEALAAQKGWNWLDIREQVKPTNETAPPAETPATKP